MTTAHELGDGRSDRVLVVSKGSVESLHARHGHRDAAEWREALQHADRLASRGLRVLAITAAEAASDADWPHVDQRLLGLVAMDDPAKPAACSTIERCVRAGITPVLITGDHPATARAIASKVGVLRPDQDGRVVTGPQIAAGEVPDLTSVEVFARTTPEQKLQIVAGVAGPRRRRRHDG